MSPEEILALANINPELEEIIKNGGEFKGMKATTDIVALRAQLAAAKRAMTAANAASGHSSVVSEEDRQIRMRDGDFITVRIYTPRQRPADGSPVLVMYHGGGYCLGGLDNEALLCHKWAAELGGVSVNVDYRLAPEHPFPVGMHDAFDALKWTAAHMEEIGGNPAKGFVCGGVSAGANFAAVISHLYRDEQITPPLTGLYLSIPPTLQPDIVPEEYKSQYLSQEQNKDAPILNRSVSELLQRNYKLDPKSPLASPFLWPTGHANLPPTYFQICGMDPLRDDGLIYEQVLREEWGIKTRMDIYKGLPHGFWSFYPKAEFSKKHLVDAMNGMKWLLEYRKGD